MELAAALTATHVALIRDLRAFVANWSGPFDPQFKFERLIGDPYFTPTSREPMYSTLKADIKSALHEYPYCDCYPCWPIDVERQNAASQRDAFAPIAPVHGPGNCAPCTVNVREILLDSRLRNDGHGRAAINAILQSVTARSDIGLQWVHMHECHFPLFFTVDSFYGWFTTTTRNWPATPAGRIFPRHFPALTAQALLENQEADLADSDLFWATPLMLAVARADMADPLPSRTITSFDYIKSSKDIVTMRIAPAHPRTSGFAALNEWLARINTAHLPVACQVPEIAAVFRLFASNIDALLPNGREKLAAEMAAHCLKLGNADTHAPAALYIQSSSNNNNGGGADRLAIELLLSFLIDHCRVMYRPLIVSAECANKLCAAYNVPSLQAFFEASATGGMPRPTPHFSRVDDRWAWLPVKKPHSTDYATGKAYIPLPAAEQPPLVLAEYDAEPLRKKHRRNLAAAFGNSSSSSSSKNRKSTYCLECGNLLPAEHAHPIALCRQGCADAYYAS